MAGKKIKVVVRGISATDTEPQKLGVKFSDGSKEFVVPFPFGKGDPIVAAIEQAATKRYGLSGQELTSRLEYNDETPTMIKFVLTLP